MRRKNAEEARVMNGERPACGRKQPGRIAIGLLILGAALWTILPAAARQTATSSQPGTIQLPSDQQGKPVSGMPDAAPRNAPAALGPPTIPIEEIIKQFAAQEGEFRAERDNFTYTQTFVFQTLDDTGVVDGEYKRVSEIVFDDKRRRIEKDTYAPVPTLTRLELTQEDLNDLEQVFPFVLTTEELPKYDIKYVDHVSLDELNTYVFDVRPKTLEKKQRYFQGRIWVDDKDLQIVKTFGQPVGYIKKNSNRDDQFPHFETFRENIEGKYWFPTYTRANEALPFRNGDVHIRMTVRYENYKRFGVTVRIGKPTEKK